MKTRTVFYIQYISRCAGSGVVTIMTYSAGEVEWMGMEVHKSLRAVWEGFGSSRS